MPTIHRVENRSLAVEYVAEHDRIISVEPAHGPNLLKRVNFSLRRHAKGKESLIGGMHLQCLDATEPGLGTDDPPCACCAHEVKPADSTTTVWDWDSALGPAYVSSLAADAYWATSLKPMETGSGSMTWERGLALNSDSSSADASYAVTNVGDTPLAIRLASLATVGRNAVIWIPVPADGQAVSLDGPNSVATWEQIATVRGRWLEIPAGGRAWKGKRRNTISARIEPAAPVIAVWTQDYWFVRVLQPNPGQATADHLIDLRFDHGAWLFHARLVGPEAHPGPGEATDLNERWFVVWAPKMNIEAVDDVLAQAGITWEAPAPVVAVEPVEEPATQPEATPEIVVPADDGTDSEGDSVEELIDIEDIVGG